MITRIHIPTEIVFDAGSFEQLGAEASRLGTKALLVTGRTSMRASGLLGRAVSNLEGAGLSVTVFDQVESNPRSSTVDAGAQIVRTSRLDLVIAMGGGSVMDAAKGIVIASADGKPVWHYVLTREQIKGTAPKLLTVPTVAASGSESNSGAVITNWDTHEKCVLGQECSFPAVSIVDPELTLTLPSKPTRQGGVDIFCHLLEPYITTTNPAPLTDGITETALKIVVDYLEKALKNPTDLYSRTQLSWVSTIACSSFTLLGGGSGARTLHGIEHPLSGFYDIAHGDGLAALLPAWMNYNYPVRKKRFSKLGKNVFNSSDGIASTLDWLERIEMALTLTSLGIDDSQIAEMAKSAVRTADWLKDNPLPLDEKHIAQIYRQSI